MKNLKNNKIWMAVAIFAVIMIVGTALTYVMYASGFAAQYFEASSKILGSWYMDYVQWFWSKWFMIALGYCLPAVGAGFISWSISHIFYISYNGDNV